MEVWNDNGVDMAFHRFGEGEHLFLWAHGWGQSHDAFMPLAQSFERRGVNCLIDFPGFGKSDMPYGDWGVGDYASSMGRFLETYFPDKKCIWIGHSFGCRVGVKLAAHSPEKFKAMCLIAGAGLPAKRSILRRLNNTVRVRMFKMLKYLTWSEAQRDKLRSYFGSADYKNAGPMRGTFLKVISEDLSGDARRVQCPVQLIYGENDTETPPDMGRRYNGLITYSALDILPHMDHYTLLGSGRHQTLKILNEFVSLQHERENA